MNRVTNISLTIFVVLTIISMISVFLKAKESMLLVLLLVLLFNSSLGLLVILIVNKIVKISKKGYPLFFAYLILSCIIFWYIASTFLHFYYNSYLSFGGIYYLIATRTLFMAFLVYIIAGFCVLALTLFLYYISIKTIVEENPPEKIMNKKIKILLIFAPILVLILVVLVVPRSYVPESSPLIDNIFYFLKVSEPKFDVANMSQFDDLNQDKVLDIKLNIEKPNVIFIMLESISAEHMPVHGYKRNITPNIDKFAEKSIIFDKAYGSSAHSDYAQTSFLSSRYMLVNPLRNTFEEYPRSFIWDILKNENYTTAYLSSQNDNWASMRDYYNLETLDVYEDSTFDDRYDYGSGNARKDYDEFTIQRSVEFVNETNNSFFLYVNLQASHYPYVYPENNSVFEPSEPSAGTSYFTIPESDYNASVNDYDNSIYYVDKQVGILLDYLEDAGLFENSIIVISADHGEILERRHKNLRHGYGVYDEEVNVPLMVYIPGEEPHVITERVRELDVVPTVLDILDLPLSEEFQGKPMQYNQDIFLMTQNQNFRVGLIKNDVKYVINGHSFETEIYNLSEDEFEQNNLIKYLNESSFYSVKSTEDEKFYELADEDFQVYGYLLYKWYNCQMEYYEEEKWLDEEVIDC